MANKLEKKIEITGTIELKTGLHIGGTNSSMQIGGIDKGVIRNPITNEPFIPGSSLKGKLRSLLQIKHGVIKTLVKPMGGNVKHVATDDKIDAELFGNATGNDTQKPSRLIVRDCELEGALLNSKKISKAELLEKTEMPYTEGKTEVVIDRITSAASPRQIERVPAGALFSLNLIVNIWEQDKNEEVLMKALFESLKLLTDDYLGGSGSRGYGNIAINITDVVEKTSDYYSNAEGKPKSIKDKYQKDIDSLKK